MKGFHVNIEEETKKNSDFRRVSYTASYMQFVYMSLKPGESIGMERHGVDQFFRFEAGKGKVIVDDNEYVVEDGFGVIVPAGAKHNVTNTSTVEELKLYTIYAIPNHKKDTVCATKAAADAAENADHFDGVTDEAA